MASEGDHCTSCVSRFENAVQQWRLEQELDGHVQEGHIMIRGLPFNDSGWEFEAVLEVAYWSEGRWSCGVLKGLLDSEAGVLEKD